MRLIVQTEDKAKDKVKDDIENQGKPSQGSAANDQSISDQNSHSQQPPQTQTIVKKKRSVSDVIEQNEN